MEKRRREQLRRQKQQDKERPWLQRVAQKQTNRQDGKDSDPAGIVPEPQPGDSLKIGMRCTTPVRFVSHRSCIRLQDGRVASRVLTRRLNMAWQLPKSQNTPPALPACSSRSAVTRTQSRSVIPAHAVTPPGISHRKITGPWRIRHRLRPGRIPLSRQFCLA